LQGNLQAPQGHRKAAAELDKGHWDYGDFWVSATIAILTVILLINVFFIPTDRKLLPIIQKALADAGDRELGLSDLPPSPASADASPQTATRLATPAAEAVRRGERRRQLRHRGLAQAIEPALRETDR
jgi:hypothetical protein